MTTLSTARLLIRPLTEEDLPVVVAYRNDPVIARYQGWTLPYTLEHARDLLSDEDLGAPGWVQHALALHDGPLLGDVALNTHGLQAELGITLARHAQGYGYAAEALAGLLDHLFSDLKLHRIHASIDPRNGAVARLLERVGFRHEGTHLKSYWHRGEWTDDAVYAVLREEWEG